MSSAFRVRAAAEADAAAVQSVCLRTGAAGQDGMLMAPCSAPVLPLCFPCFPFRSASAQYPHHPQLLGERWAAPYVMLPGAVGFLLEDDDGVCGYTFAALV